MYTWNITTRLIYREASTCLSFFSFLFNHTFFPMSLFCLAQQERINASLERTNPGITIKRAIAQNRLRLREWKLGEQDNKQTPTRKRAVWGRPRQKVKEKTHESIKGDQPSSLLHPPFKKKRPTLVISLQVTWRARLVHRRLASNAQRHPSGCCKKPLSRALSSQKFLSSVTRS